MKFIVSDILASGADIIAFSAHPSLLSGSGVSGIVHKAAGPELELFTKSLGPIAPGQSIITPAFNLRAKHIIHTVCPRYIYGTPEEESLLAMAYRSALSLKNSGTRCIQYRLRVTWYWYLSLAFGSRG